MHSVGCRGKPTRYNNTTSGLASLSLVHTIASSQYSRLSTGSQHNYGKIKKWTPYRSFWMLYSLAAALLLKFQREANFQGQKFCLGHFTRVGYHLICKRCVYWLFSIEQAISGMWGKVKIHWPTGTPRKAPTRQNHQQLDKVPRSIGGKSRKAKKVARNGTT